MFIPLLKADETVVIKEITVVDKTEGLEIENELTFQNLYIHLFQMKQLDVMI